MLGEIAVTVVALEAFRVVARVVEIVEAVVIIAHVAVRGRMMVGHHMARR